MTDARLPGRWLTDPRLDGLSDRLWRVHSYALMWSAEQGTDGLIPRTSLRLLHPDAATPDDAHGLVLAGFWAAEGTDYRVLGWGQSQSLAADVERGRAANRERQGRHRAKSSKPTAEPVEPGPVTRDVTRDVTRESPRQGEARQGQARTGQASEKPRVTQPHGATDSVGTSWPSRVPGEPELWTTDRREAS